MRNAATTEKNYRSDIDGLRAIAVVSVVIFHAFPTLLPGGFVGVDIFFVISGFLISGIISDRLLAGNFSFLDFYGRRIRRIVPTLLVVLTACYSIGWATLLPGEFKQLGKHIVAGVAFVSNFTLWREAGYFDSSANLKPLLHLWSLGIEEQFYIVWPLALWLCRKRGFRELVLITSIGLGSFAINLATAHSHPTADFYSPLSRFWELQIGALLANLNRTRGPLPAIVVDGASFTGMILLAISIGTFDSKLSFPGCWALLPTSGAFLLIAAGPNAWVNRYLLSRRAMIWVGLISYPLYLWHWPLLSFAFINLSAPSVGTRLLILAASIALSAATYNLIDKPIRFGTGGRSKAIALVAICSLAGCVGYGTYEQAGIPSRFPKAIEKIANFKYNPASGARAGECWLSDVQPYNGFAPYCSAAPKDGNSVMIWGDSHAGRLYPGLVQVEGSVAGISQFTRDSCPPILGYGYDVCQNSNTYTLSKIARIKPHTVILFAVWSHYQSDWATPSDVKSAFLSTIQKLKSIGVENVIVLGPAPVWKEALPKLIYLAWKNGTPFHAVPARLSIGLDPSAATVDAEMRQMLRGQPVKYVSLLDFLCDPDGCLTHVPGHDSRLLTWDYGHLTTDGSALVSRQLAAAKVIP